MTKIANAISIWFEAMAQTMTGTRMMRPRVMMFGILNAALPGYRPGSSPLRAEAAVIYIV